jgi:hypothetical protein
VRETKENENKKKLVVIISSHKQVRTMALFRRESFLAVELLFIHQQMQHNTEKLLNNSHFAIKGKNVRSQCFASAIHQHCKLQNKKREKKSCAHLHSRVKQQLNETKTKIALAKRGSSSNLRLNQLGK